MPENKNDSTEDPSCFIFVTGSVEWEPFTSASEIVRRLAAAGTWLASSVTPYKSLYKRGDRVLLYASGKGARCFLGEATLAGPVEEATEADRKLAQELGLEGFEERIPFEQVRLWEESVPLKPLVPELGFLTNKQDYGLHLRQAARKIPASDFQRVLQEIQQ